MNVTEMLEAFPAPGNVQELFGPEVATAWPGPEVLQLPDDYYVHVTVYPPGTFVSVDSRAGYPPHPPGGYHANLTSSIWMNNG